MENAPLSHLEQRLIAHLQVIYPSLDNKDLAEKCLATFQLDPMTESPRPHRNLWDQSDIMLITYADTLRQEEEAPLETLHKFVKNKLSDCISAVHLLPFFPYSSDDGFSV
ncbi:MAG: alpha-amylase, partial [Marinomonas sp.]